MGTTKKATADAPASRQYLETFESYLRGRDLRLTTQRREIARAIMSTRDHLTAEQIMALVRKRNSTIGRSTIYRTLDHLVDCGLVQRLDLGGDAKLYEHTVGQEHHDHLRCNTCGRIDEFECPAIEELQEKVAQERGFHIVSHRHEIFGVCRDCRAKQAPE